MLGLPGDNPQRALYTAKRTIQEMPNGVRIYPVVVLKDTALADYYREGLYKPWTLTETVDMGAQWLAMFSSYNIPVIRLGLQSTESLRNDGELLAGPYHPAYGELVESRLMLEQLKDLICRIEVKVKPHKVKILFNTRDYSKVIGHKRTNSSILKSIFPETYIEFTPNANINNNDLSIETESQTIYLSRQEFLEKYRIKDEDYKNNDTK
jgi:histone acetyltransferase (RNA polymerase elongator complex component)